MRKYIACCLLAFLAVGCSGRKVDLEASDAKDEKDPHAQALAARDAKIESLTSALSRAQSRIEELDAKVSALTDKLDATKITVDNVVGNKPLSTEPVGAARLDPPHPKESATHEKASEHTAEASEQEKPLTKADGATGEFNKGMSLYRMGKYPDAELVFSHFTEEFPEHILAGSAQYYAGESYFMMNEYKLALNEYGKVIQTFASSPRVASAMVRMSHCYDAIGNSTEAARALATARDIFAGNPALDMQGVAKHSKPQSSHKELSTEPMEPSEHKEKEKTQ